MVLDIFRTRFGDEERGWINIGKADSVGPIAVEMLDAVQTVVDVLTDNDGGGSWTVSFDPTLNAYTDRSARRRIVVSAKPLLDAAPGTPLDQIAAIMTGFAVHEIGHTKINFYEAVKDRWPGKQLPLTLANIIEDVVLEAMTADRYAGLRDVFAPTIEWVAKLTCPTTPLKWSGSSGHRVNVVGQIVRYRDYVTFESDSQTQAALHFVENWMTGITKDLTPSGCVALIEALLPVILDHSEDEPVEEPPTTCGPEGPTGDGPPPIPNEDPDDEPPTGEGKGEGPEGPEPPEGPTPEGPEGPDGGETPGPDGGNVPGPEGPEGGDTPGGDGPDTDTPTTDGGEGKGDRPGDGNDADTSKDARTKAEAGANDKHGGGGTGQAVADSLDDAVIDDGFDPKDVGPTMDDLAHSGDIQDRIAQRRVAEAEQEERRTERLDAGKFGKMRVIFL